MKYLKPITLTVFVLMAAVVLYLILTHESKTEYVIENRVIVSCDTNVRKLIIPDNIEGYSVDIIGEKAFMDNKTLINVVLLEGIERIMTNAFYNCTALREINIPKTVTNIELEAFSKCPTLVKINVDGANKNYDSFNGVLYNKGVKYLICFPTGYERDEFFMPHGTMTIKEKAFIDSRLTAIYIPETVLTIESFAFANNEKLKSINLPEYLMSLGEGAFINNTNLKSITIGANVKLGVDIVGNDTFNKQYEIYGAGTYIKVDNNEWIRLDND